MVKIQDGSLVPASELINGGGQDDEGNNLKFELVKDATIPAFEAKRKMTDGSGRTRTYRFGFEDINVTVHMTQTEEKPAETKKVTKEVIIQQQQPSAAEVKKNSQPPSPLRSDHYNKHL